MAKKRKDNRYGSGRRALIYVRYLFPVAMLLLLLLLMQIPCLRYTTADTGAQEAISFAELAGNSWDQVRSYIFGSGGEKDANNLYFSKVVFATLIVFWILYFLAFAFAVYTAIEAFRHFREPGRQTFGRILFMTLMPNRVVYCLTQLLFLPLLFFPHVIILFYENILHYHVVLTVTFPEPMVFGVIFYLALVILTAVSAGSEQALGMNPFAGRRPDFADDDGNDPT